MAIHEEVLAAGIAPTPSQMRVDTDLTDAPTPLAATIPQPRVAKDASQEDEVASTRAYERLKRAIDVVGSAAGLIVLTPVFIAIGVAVRLEDGGPILHRRQIVGRDGRQVYALKFRTMIPNADEYLALHPTLAAEYSWNVKLRDDPRITRVGALLRRTSLDELPQLVNVLRGEMSLVGPRMIHPSEEDRYGVFSATRRRVRPGITGLWQVSGRQELAYTQRIELDRLYLRRRCLRLDLRILLSTIPALLLRRGAY